MPSAVSPRSGSKPVTRPVQRALALAVLAAAFTTPAVRAQQPAERERALEGAARLVGFRWLDVAERLPVPDSGAVDQGRGRVAWRQSPVRLLGVEMDVAGGTVHAVALVFPADSGVVVRMGEVQAALEARSGPPADPPFFSADQVQAVPGFGWVDLWLDASRHRLVVRKPLTPPPPAPPPPPPAPPEAAPAAGRRTGG